MTPVQIAFIVLAALTLGNSIAVVTVRNLFHAALYLVGALLGVAGLYLLLEAGFLAAAQLLIYVGAIAILIIFAVMLTRGVMGRAGGQVNTQWGYGLVAALLLFGLLVSQLWVFPWKEAGLAEAPRDGLQILGKSLVDPAAYMLPFEVASVLLLAALIGAIYIARERKT
jgi:NADH:ubiquinone oxidoreductase subunit 6 (subunit J)